MALSHLYYRTSTDQLQNVYGTNFQEPFGSGRKFTTLLPKNIVIIRLIVSSALTALYAVLFSSPIGSVSIVAMGITYAGWMIYSHILCKDPLMEAFYKIIGGEDNFKKLPRYKFDAYSENISQDLKKIKWENLNGPIFRAKTKDGRTILIIKGLSRNPTVDNLHTQSIFIFIERLGPYDIDQNRKNIFSPAVRRILQTVGHSIAFFTGNIFDEVIRAEDIVVSGLPSYNRSLRSNIESSITSELANELFAQLSHGYDGYF